MTIRVSLLPYGPSESCNLLRNALREAIEELSIDATINLLRSDGTSNFSGQAGRILINYGNRRYPQTFFGQATVLNSLSALNLAANKTQALTTLRNAQVPTVEFTTNAAEAQAWVANGSTVYARATLNDHSGEGITVHSPDENPTVPAVPLYTKGITSQRREWRVHVFKGKISYVQLKKRRDGWREDPNYREDVRNHHTGWIYSTNPANQVPSDAVLRSAYDAVAALGLDFGAVDIISRQEDVWVLEVNTAPGLTGTTLETYKHNFMEFVKESATRIAPNYLEAYPVPAPRPAPTMEAVAEQSAPVAPVSTVTMDTVQHETHPGMNLGAGMTTAELSRLDRGLYLANLSSANESSEGVIAQNVVLYISNGYAFRHGWNLPVRPNLIRSGSIRKISSVTLDTGANVPL